jgi:V/A-type H+-transporting ATPase subunit I
MLGDVGYGIATFMIFYGVKKKFPDTRQFMNVLMIASLVTIAFGGVYGEYLGFEYVSEATGEAWCEKGICFHKELLEHHGHEEIVYSFPRLIQRSHDSVSIGGMDLLSVLFIGILIGAVHVNIGLLVGFFNKLKAHGLKHAIFEKFSWFVMQAGVVLIITSLLGVTRIRVWVGAGVFFLSAVMLYIGEGPQGIIEIPAIFSNMLSYVRLGAVGLASLGLALVVNEELALPLMAKGGVWILLGITVMIIGHLINIALGVLGPFLHGIRLHYVEFFSKFFSGGGQEYEPFGLNDTEV